MSSADNLEFNTVSCAGCGRANHPAAARCLWCGVPVFAVGQTPGKQASVKTTVELDYLDGIERFDNPVPVRLTISAEGIELREVLPGTRVFTLTADALVEATFTDATVVIEKEKRRSLWGWLMLGSAASGKAKAVEEIKHDYLLTIGYRAGDETKTAVFHREDAVGFSYVKNVAAIINALIKSRAAKP